jgi:hypothetical protein
MLAKKIKIKGGQLECWTDDVDAGCGNLMAYA